MPGLTCIPQYSTGYHLKPGMTTGKSCLLQNSLKENGNLYELVNTYRPISPAGYP